MTIDSLYLQLTRVKDFDFLFRGIKFSPRRDYILIITDHRECPKQTVNLSIGQ
jgi:hypothetical protein